MFGSSKLRSWVSVGDLDVWTLTTAFKDCTSDAHAFRLDSHGPAFFDARHQKTQHWTSIDGRQTTVVMAGVFHKRLLGRHASYKGGGIESASAQVCDRRQQLASQTIFGYKGVHQVQRLLRNAQSFGE